MFHSGFDEQFSKDIECLFLGLLTIAVSSLEKCIFKFFARFKIRLLTFVVAEC